jgi:multisubunit Na+/H+ antiporter MnhF subunit
MIQAAINFGYVGLTLAIFFGLYRLVKGPTVMDRILSFELISTCAVGMVVLLSLEWRSPFYLELILIFSLLGFFTTVALLYHLHQTYVPEEEREPGADEQGGR